MLSEPDFNNKKILLVFPKNEDKISFKNDNIIITNKENKIINQLSCWRLFAVFVVGGFSITTGIIERSKRFGFSIVLFTTSFKVYSTINYSLEGNTLLRKKQYTSSLGNDISKEIIINKIINQKYILEKLRDKSMISGIEKLDECIKKLQLNNYSEYEMMGIEGIASKVYFKRIFREFNWTGRQPRVKRDEINLLLDIGYTILFNYIEAILNIYGFDIYKGNLHKEFYKRKSLVCDIIEPFRPIIDYKIRKAINLGQINNYKFLIYNGQYQLKWQYSSDFVELILKEIIKYKHNIFIFIQKYYRWFMKDEKIERFPKVTLKIDINKL